MIQLSPAETPATARVVRDAIASILPHLRPDSISGAKGLAEYGADSVDRVEIILSILGRLRLDAPMSAFSSITTIDGLVDYLCRLQQQQH